MTSADGENLGGNNSGGDGTYLKSVRAPIHKYPLYVTAKGGESMVSRRAPDFVLRGAVTSTDADVVANVNSFSTLAIKIAGHLNGGLSSANLRRAEKIVVDNVSSGLDKLADSGPMSTRIDHSNISELAMASATLSEIFLRTHSALVAAGYDFDVDEVVDALAADLIDGVIEGSGGAGANARIAATANATAAQVLLEAMTAELRVDNFRATEALRNATRLASGDVPSPGLEELTPDDRMIAQWHDAVYAVAAVSNDAVTLEVAAVADTIAPGMYPDDVWAVLPRGWRNALGDAATEIAAGDENVVSAVNSAARSGNRGRGNVNRAPTISGTPSDSVTVGDPYEFSPIASDLDGDKLNFKVSNRPAWLSFDKVTGRLSGTPAVSDEGLHEEITITVSDGLASDKVGPFSIMVAGKDKAPTISGTPPGKVRAGEGYSFVPDASDPDGADLSFSIDNKPAWANFSIATGALTGTPQTVDIGKHRDIVIAVTDGSFTAKLDPFTIEVVAADTEVGSVSLQWTPPTRNTDGTTLTNLAGFRVYWRSQAGNFNNSMIISNPNVSRVVIDDLAPGDYDFAITAFNTYGGESRFSNTVSKIVN